VTTGAAAVELPREPWPLRIYRNFTAWLEYLRRTIRRLFQAASILLRPTPVNQASPAVEAARQATGQTDARVGGSVRSASVQPHVNPASLARSAARMTARAGRLVARQARMADHVGLAQELGMSTLPDTADIYHTEPAEASAGIAGSEA
jgi:hypothetical protein